MEEALFLILPLVLGYLLDLLLGDPDNWPHPVRVYGHAIAWGEKYLNRGCGRFWKGSLMALTLLSAAYFFFLELDRWLLAYPFMYLVVNTLFVYYGLANRALIDEGAAVFKMLDEKGLEAGRKQLSRIVGRDTSGLTAQRIRIAVLETMSENLSDGVVAPLFYYAVGGVPGMMAYKMVNTMDSMLGYRNGRYEWFGKFAARMDDVANFIPARLTAIIMVSVAGSRRGLQFILRFGHLHKSPNAGYPEAALAGILNCRFGGPNVYHGILVEKPFIGVQEREIAANEMMRVARINHRACFLMVLIVVIFAIKY